MYVGPGRLFVKELAAFKPGSPVEAVGIKSPFDINVFADLDDRCVECLQQRVGTRPGVSVLKGDANTADLHDCILQLVPRNALIVLYADPYGLDLHFDTLRFFAERYQALHLLLNFPEPGIDRALSAGQNAKASLVLNYPSQVELIGRALAARARRCASTSSANSRRWATTSSLFRTSSCTRRMCRCTT